MPDDDETADKYVLADEKFLAAGFDWYELSNWSKPGSQCRHNMAYWNGDNWWGAGPGAHSHIDGRRFWNVKHPNAYKEKMASTGNPMHEQEILDPHAIKSEATMLQIRLREGISSDGLGAEVSTKLQGYVDGGFLDPIAWKGGRVVLTRTGRLIADRIVREILF